MNTSQEKNHTAFDEANHELDERYPPGQFIAFHDGEIVGDAASFDELLEVLDAAERELANVLVVQAGAYNADEVFIVG
jgi:hypothetical protein